LTCRLLPLNDSHDHLVDILCKDRKYIGDQGPVRRDAVFCQLIRLGYRLRVSLPHDLWVIAIAFPNFLCEF
jgi:hypothetical protein